MDEVWIVYIMLLSMGILGLFMGYMFGAAYGELECIDFNKPLYQHIHVIVSPPFPDGINVTPYYGGDDTCIRVMHTHMDSEKDYGFIHLESNGPRNFTLSEFLDYVNKTAMDYSSLTINGKPADFNTILHDQDRIKLISLYNDTYN